MISSILFVFSAFAILFLVIIGVLIIYHLKRFGIKDDPNVKKILNTFKIGALFLIGLNITLLLFLFNFLKK